MALRLEDKKAFVSEIAAVAAESQSVIAAEYRGLTAQQMDHLRVAARDNGVYMRVVKNTLARRALADTAFDCIRETLSGPLLLAFSREDPAAAARVVREFARDNDKLVVKAVSMGGNLLPVSDVARLADLPSRAQALSMLAGVLQAPVAKLVRTLAAPHAKLVRTVAAVRDVKQAA